MRLGLDYAWGRLTPAQHKAVGSSFAARYLSHTTSKNLTRGEAAGLQTGGIDIVSVWETTAARALDGRPAGQDDAQAALALAAVDGILGGRPIFFAVDFDMQPSQAGAVGAYFQGVQDVFGNQGPADFPQSRPVGVYGGYAVVKYLFDHGLVSYAWQTYAWSRGLLDRRAGLYQFSNGHRVAGVGVDFNHALKDDFGQWGFRPPKPKPPTDPMNYARYDNVPRLLCKRTVERRLARRYDELRAQQTWRKHPHRAELAALRAMLDCHARRLRSLIDAKDVRCSEAPAGDPDHLCWRQYRLGRRAAGKTVHPDKKR